MKKILGLDLGSTSIGWAVIFESNNSKTIEALGSRIIPYEAGENDDFNKGKGESKNSKRTIDRTLRKRYDRFQLRRKELTHFLHKFNMLPNEELITLEKVKLWQLRANATKKQLTLPEIGRVLYHLNQKRGYRATKNDYNQSTDESSKNYVRSIISRYDYIKKHNLTIGEYFYKELSQNSSYRTKEKIFPRKAYEDEFDCIIKYQKQFYPTIFKDENIYKLRNEIIYYQRALKSCKHLVSKCDLEKKPYINQNTGLQIISGPNVAHRSSPLAQVCSIWESVNNITLKNKYGHIFEITPSQRKELFEFLNNNNKLTISNLYSILNISKKDGWWGGKAIGKGIQGNNTKNRIKEALKGKHNHLLQFHLTNQDTNLVDSETGEVIQIISDRFEQEPLYRLWHIIYSIKDKEEFTKAIKKVFNIDDYEIIDNLFSIPFENMGYSNKSSKAMRRILPYLQLGLIYSDSCQAAGLRHSESLTTEENLKRTLVDKLKPISKNELRQPIVEKILNQMINVVNALTDKYGRFTEIRVELTRELKQSKEERSETSKNINKAERLNKTYAERIIEEYKLAPTRSRIQKYKMWEESNYKCMYCGNIVDAKDFLLGSDVEVEHILPRSIFYDDSFANKVCSCKKCNREKNNKTAYDFMSSKSDLEFNKYIDQIEKLYKEKKIGKLKYERLLTSGDNLPTDFISRQLKESQFIAKRAKDILTSICYNVTSTTGSVTDLLRRLWGWDNVLHNLNYERYEIAGQVETVERKHKNNIWNENRIRNWSKRMDHRHHAIDALIIACTKQGYIQRINNMSLIKDVPFASKNSQGDQYKQRLSILEKYLISEPHFSTKEVEEAASNILISFKAGKKATSTGKRYIKKQGKRVVIQTKVIIPRGALHEGSIYGVINKNGKDLSVIRYPLSSITTKDVNKIVDKKIKELVTARFELYNWKDKEVWKNIESEPLLFNNTPIRTVRRFARPNVNSILKIDRGFINLGNNHHIAIYTDKDGKRKENCVSFWHAVERKKYKTPIIITDTKSVWDNLSIDVNEDFCNQLPSIDWSFEVSLQQNEMFILGMNTDDFEDAIKDKNYKLLSQYLYKVQNISSCQYRFCLHNMTQYDINYLNTPDRRFLNINSINTFLKLNPQKVRISLIGEIIGL